jgi:hypothetical protein
VKIILEFGEGEEERAEQSYQGPQLYAAALDFSNYLFQLKKHREMSEESYDLLTEAHKEFCNLFQPLTKEL